MRAVLSRTASVAVLAALVPAAAAAAPDAERGDASRERGDRGDDVREQQDVLTTVGMRTVADGLSGASTAASVRRLAADAPAPDASPKPARRQRAFPIDGSHTYGDGFGDRANHQGADVLAACGTPLRAITGGTVRKVATDGGAGRYVVLRDGHSGEEYVYMHLSDVAVSSGERVRAGERLGAVGQTGNATTCHLHFEVWSAPGWYAGGSPHDPMPDLRAARA